MQRLISRASKIKYIGKDFLDFILGLITGLVIMYVAVALGNKEKTYKEKTISFMNTNTILSLEEERSYEEKNEEFFKGINWENRLHECKSQIEKKYHTKIIVVERDLKGLQDYSQAIHMCSINSHMSKK